jgi:hypothetical protein
MLISALAAEGPLGLLFRPAMKLPSKKEWEEKYEINRTELRARLSRLAFIVRMLLGCIRSRTAQHFIQRIC